MWWRSHSRADWRPIVNHKLQETSAKIREEWLLSDLQIREARSRRDVTGEFIMAFLDEADVEITGLTALELARQIRQGDKTAKQITLAFCHRAAVAHQIVSIEHWH